MLGDGARPMNICPYCEHNNLEGALVCDHCGRSRSLSVFAGIATRQVDYKPESFSARWQGTDSFSADTVVVIHLREAGEPLVLPVASQTVLGRASLDRSRNPDVDLTRFNAFGNGVSSQHAALQREANRLMLVDMASTNGTYLNGRRLAPYQAVALHDGDEVRLGALIISVYFESSVAASS